ncbi:MAG: VOC family protein [Actinomycetota bacterium]|nr:VOC family protein [Actinomycetota bacterium]
MTELSGIHHVKLPVRDVARSRDWYCQLLGFSVEIEFIENNELMGVGLHHASGMRIALRRDPQRAACLAGFDPLALAVTSAEELQAHQKLLHSQGQEPGEIVQGHRGMVLVGTHNIDGLEIRLYADQQPNGTIGHSH